MAGRFAAAERNGDEIAAPPPTTAHGALLAHITGGHIEAIESGPRSFQPMNVNFGLFPPLAQVPTKKPNGSRLRGTEKTVAKKQALSARALADLEQWIGGARIAAE
jgi:methylenetetrahydrofolate--tRNA-(uracil-5-)-methyltransferase